MEYSIVIPVYNSSKTLYELMERLIYTMEKYEYEIILVEDGSNDNSWLILKELKQLYKINNIKTIKLLKNFGQQNATMCGLNFASGDYTVTIDDDLQIPPKEIDKLINKIKETSSDIAYGIYKEERQSITRQFFKKIAFSMIRKINPTIEKTSSFRIINKKLYTQLNKQRTHFINIDELVQWYTNSISIVEVEHFPRKKGKSGYSLFSLMKLSLNTLFKFYSFPLQLITTFGFYISFFSFILGSFYFLKKIYFHVAIEGWTSLMVVLLFSTGIIVFCLGIIGKYLLELIAINENKPQYFIDEIN